YSETEDEKRDNQDKADNTVKAADRIKLSARSVTTGKYHNDEQQWQSTNAGNQKSEYESISAPARLWWRAHTGLTLCVRRAGQQTQEFTAGAIRRRLHAVVRRHLHVK